DVLVDVEDVLRVVALLDPGEPVVVAAVGGPDPVLALGHHEVDVGAAGRGRVQRLPVLPGPLRHRGHVGRVRVDADDDAGPAAVAIGERGGVLRHPAGGTVDRVQVHGGVPGGQLRAVLEVRLDGVVGDLVVEVGLPVPLETGRVKGVERALQGGERHVVQA